MAEAKLEKTRIGILVHGFAEWGGGIDFLRYLLLGIDQSSFEIVIFIPKYSLGLFRFKNGVKKLLASSGIPFFKNRFFPGAYLSPEFILDKLSASIYCSQVVKYRYRRQSLVKEAKKAGVSVLLPSIQTLGKNFPIPWIGYIFDYQHRYLLDLFGEKERFERDRMFNNILDDAPIVLVNANEVKKDIIRFHGKANHVDVLPFTPFFDSARFSSIVPFDVIKQKYSLSDRYFVISNQFWSHKGHLTAFKAFLNLTETYTGQVQLICTGKMEDYRNPDYIIGLSTFLDENNLHDKIRLVGFLSKNDQLSIMRYSTAVIQPTTFEGGPGGGAVFEATAYGIRSIVSNISVNKEISHPLVTFFEVGNVEDLKEKMLEHLESDFKSPDDNELKLAFESKRTLLTQTISALISKAISNG